MAMTPAFSATMRWAHMPPLTVVGIAIVALLIGVALLGPLLTPHDPYQFSIRMNEGPSGEHWLGTDDQGHDVLSRLIAGARLRPALPGQGSGAGRAFSIGALFVADRAVAGTMGGNGGLSRSST